jgi:hypothetical protein
MVMPEEIQPGWLVVDSFGEEIGTVLSAGGANIKVKKYGGSGEFEVPNSACATIETGRVELNMTKKEIEAGAGAQSPA